MWVKRCIFISMQIFVCRIITEWYDSTSGEQCNHSIYCALGSIGKFKWNPLKNSIKKIKVVKFECERMHKSHMQESKKQNIILLKICFRLVRGYEIRAFLWIANATYGDSILRVPAEKRDDRAFLCLPHILNAPKMCVNMTKLFAHLNTI